MKKVSYMLGMLSLGCALQGYSLNVSPMLVYFHAGSSVQDLTLENVDSVVEYASVTPLYLKNMGLSTAESVPFNGANPRSFGLMVSPTKLALQPNTSRKIRIVNLLGNVSADRVYTLTVDNVNPAEKVVAEGDNGTATADLTMSYGYKVSVFVLPVNPLPVVTAKRDGVNVTITNTGNSYISLRSGQLCDVSGAKCKPLSDALDYHVLYAGNSWTYTLPTAGVVKYNGVYAETKSMPVTSN